MKRRIIVFKSQKGYYASPVLQVEDKSSNGIQDSVQADIIWNKVATTMSRVKTLDEFERGVLWAQKQYHMKDIQPAKPYTFSDDRVDDIFMVYEDLHTTGMEGVAVCGICGKAFPIKYLPDGTTKATPDTCFSCKHPLELGSGIPSKENWKTMMVLSDCKECEGWVLNPDSHLSTPEIQKHRGKAFKKIEKCVGWNGKEALFQIRFEDKESAIVPTSEFACNPNYVPKEEFQR